MDILKFSADKHGQVLNVNKQVSLVPSLGFGAPRHHAWGFPALGFGKWALPFMRYQQVSRVVVTTKAVFCTDNPPPPLPAWHPSVIQMEAYAVNRRPNEVSHVKQTWGLHSSHCGIIYSVVMYLKAFRITGTIALTLLLSLLS